MLGGDQTRLPPAESTRERSCKSLQMLWHVAKGFRFCFRKHAVRRSHLNSVWQALLNRCPHETKSTAWTWPHVSRDALWPRGPRMSFSLSPPTRARCSPSADQPWPHHCHRPTHNQELWFRVSLCLNSSPGSSVSAFPPQQQRESYSSQVRVSGGS